MFSLPLPKSMHSSPSSHFLFHFPSLCNISCCLPLISFQAVKLISLVNALPSQRPDMGSFSVDTFENGSFMTQIQQSRKLSLGFQNYASFFNLVLTARPYILRLGKYWPSYSIHKADTSFPLVFIWLFLVGGLR